MRKGMSLIEWTLAIVILVMALLPLIMMFKEHNNPRPRPVVARYTIEHYDGKQATATAQKWEKATYITFYDAEGKRVEMTEGTYVIKTTPEK